MSELEIYTKIKNFEDTYAVSNLGNVLNIKTGLILKSGFDSRGYYIVSLYKNGKRTMKKIHRLVAEHFIDNPNNCECVDHIDRDRTNNSISNLRWCSYSENNRNSTKQKNCSSAYKGVSYYKQYKKWRCQIRVDRKQIHIGYYDNEIDSAKAYNNYIIANGLSHFVLNEV